MDLGSVSEFWALVKDVWQNGLYGIDISEILIALGIFFLFIIFRGLFTRIILGRIEKIVSRTNNTVDDDVLTALKPPVQFVPVVLGVFFATNYLTLDETPQLFVNNLNRSLIAFNIFWALYQASGPMSEYFMNAAHLLTTAMVQWMSKAARIAFVLLGGATILEIWGIEVGALLAGLGLFGVAVALGAQDLFKNLIAGLFIIGERRFHPGDWVLVRGLAEGTVEEIGFRTTTIRRFDKAPVYVPNSKLSDNAVINFTRMTYRRISWVIGLEYRSTEAQLREVRDNIERYILDSDDFVNPEDATTMVRIDRFSSSSIDIMLYCFTHTTNWLAWLEIKERLLLAVKKIVEDAGTGFAFPSQSLYLEAIGDDLEIAPLHFANTNDSHTKGKSA